MMSHRVRTQRRWRWSLILPVLILLAALPGYSHAQTGTIAYGETATGSLTTSVPFMIYQFTGAEADEIAAYAIGVTPGMAPTLTLLGPDQRQLATSDGNLFGTQDAAVAILDHHLPQTGSYALMISNLNGTPGDFLLHLGRSAVQGASGVPPAVLQAGALITHPINAGDPPTAFTFTVDPGMGSTLTLYTGDVALSFYADVYDRAGQLIARLGGPAVAGASLSLRSGGTYAVTVRAMQPDMTGTVQLQLGGGGVGGPAITLATATPAFCRATSGVNVNVRTGPATNYPAFGSLFENSYLEVIGRNADGSWYVVNYNGRQGWVASSVVMVEGPCSSLPYVVPPPSPIPQVPTATPTSEPPFISFTVNGTNIANITAGNCVTIDWNTANVREVYYEGTGVTGIGSRTECPAATRAYTLRVILRDGTEALRTVAVNVSP